MEKSEPDWAALVRAALAKSEVPVVSGTLWRIVESQSQVATLDLVDSLEEQEVLEEMVEASKPPPPADTGRLHYLLATPFRYPPLKWGSRFGTRFLPSIFYGSKRIPTALAEAAYYRFVFWHGMEIPPPGGRLVTQHDIFSARYRAIPGLQLQHDPFAGLREEIAGKDRYVESQRLGEQMRDQLVEGFEFESARCPDGGINVGLFVPRALLSRRPGEVQRWLCETSAESVVFRGESGIDRFSLAQFVHRGSLPLPS